MTNPVSSQRFLDGLSARLDLCVKILDWSDPVYVAPPADGISLNALWSIRSKPIKPIPELELVKISLKLRSVADQMRFLTLFQNDAVRRTVKLLTVGASFESNISDDQWEAASDYSLAVTSQVLASKCTLQLDAIQRVKAFSRDIELTPANSASSFKRYIRAFSIFADSIKDVSAIQTGLHALKQSYWAVLGPDLLSILQAMCDPIHELSEPQLEICHTLSQVWQLSGLFAKLLVMRALGGCASEEAFLKKHTEIVAERANFNYDLACGILCAMGLSDDANYVKTNAAFDPLNETIALLVNVRLAANWKDLSSLKHTIVSLYHVDQLAHGFINWQIIHENFELPASDADAFAIFLKFLMSTPAVGRRFLSVAVARGKGSLTADISSFVSRVRSRTEGSNDDVVARVSQRSRPVSNQEFIRRFKSLPTRPRHRLLEEILDKGMMERLAFAFPTSIPLSSENLPRVDNQSSILRMELANLSKRENALSEVQANRIIEDETHFLRMHRFHNLFRAGKSRSTGTS